MKNLETIDQIYELQVCSPKNQNNAENNRPDFIPNYRPVSVKVNLQENVNSSCSSTRVKNPAGRAYLRDGISVVDYVLVFEQSQNEPENAQRIFYEQNLVKNGLILETDPQTAFCGLGDGLGGSRLNFVRVHAPWETLCRTAELLRLKAPLKIKDSSALLKRSRRDAVNRSAWESTFFQPPSNPFLLSLWNYMPWLKFNDDEKELLRRVSPQNNFSYGYVATACFVRARMDRFLIMDKSTFFDEAQRIRIVYDVLQRTKCDPDDGKKRGVQWLITREVYLTAYPLHDGGLDVQMDQESSKSSQKFKQITSTWSRRHVLRHTWANFRRLFKPQPLNLIRSYFGEQIGFYFAWLGFYTHMLVYPSIVGLICFLYGIFALPNNPIHNDICNNHTEPGNLIMCPVCRLPMCDPWPMSSSCDSADWNYRFDQEAQLVASIFTLLWATVFVEMWKRREAQLAYKWDVAETDDDATPGDVRPEFERRTRHTRLSPVTDEHESHMPAHMKFAWLACSLTGLALLVAVVVGAVVALIVVRILLYGFFKSFGGIWFKQQFEFASLVIHVITFLLVIALGWFYTKAAHRLTALECPKTQSDYVSSYVWKVFMFELLNNFAPIFYAALVRGRNLRVPSQQSWLQEMCDPGGCLNEVVQAIAILLLARLVISNAGELFIPFIISVLNDMKMAESTSIVAPSDFHEPSIIANGGLSGAHLAQANHQLPSTISQRPIIINRWQKDYTLNELSLDGVYTEYLEMMVQFGYVVLFAPAFPLAPVICLLNNILEIRLDAINFVTAFRRPLPMRVSGIRIWRRCLDVIVKLAVLTNAGFLAFTSELIPQWVYRWSYSKDGSARGYVLFSLSRFNTTGWLEFEAAFPQFDHCYYRDFRGNDHNNALWWQLMLARLSFFSVYVVTFLLIQWLCDLLVPSTPSTVRRGQQRAEYLAHKAMCSEASSKKTSNQNDRSSPNKPQQQQQMKCQIVDVEVMNEMHF